MKFTETLSAFLLLAMPTASAQPSFKCPEGTMCMEFTDGCNTCSSPDGNTAPAVCTEMWCECYDDNSCVPQCMDNDQCVSTKDSCTPSDEALCGPAIGCAPPSPDSDCTVIEGDFVLNEAGNCCQQQCVFVNSNGGPCTWGEDVPTSITEVGELENQVGEICTPPSVFDETLCGPAIGCAPPSPDSDCTAIEGDFVLNEAGNCCQQQCVFVNNNGGPCTWGEDAPAITEVGLQQVSLEDNNNNLQLGDMCSPLNENPVLVSSATKQATDPEDAKCPIAGCAPAPLGCEYKMDHYVINALGDCCPELCYAVDSDGHECVEYGAGSTSGSGSGNPSLWLTSSLIAAAVLLLAAALN